MIIMLSLIVVLCMLLSVLNCDLTSSMVSCLASCSEAQKCPAKIIASLAALHVMSPPTLGINSSNWEYNCCHTFLFPSMPVQSFPCTGTCSDHLIMHISLKCEGMTALSSCVGPFNTSNVLWPFSNIFHARCK